jgi:hypothetical protein
MNEVMRMHYRMRAKQAAYWKDTFATLARQARIPRLENISLELLASLPPPLRDRDSDAEAAILKFARDGLVVARVIPDDNWRHVKSYTVHRPQVAAPEWRIRLLVKDEGRAATLDDP